MTGGAHRLPFGQLDPLKFEELCLWLVRREGYEQAEHLGQSGSEQGRDIVRNLWVRHTFTGRAKNDGGRDPSEWWSEPVGTVIGSVGIRS